MSSVLYRTHFQFKNNSFVIIVPKVSKEYLLKEGEKLNT